MVYNLTFLCNVCGIGWVDRGVESVLDHLDKLSDNGCPLCGQYRTGSITLVETERYEADKEGHEQG